MPMIRAYLGLSGIIAALIGASILAAPHAIFASNQIMLGADPSLLSEIRAPGGLLLTCGVLMLAGAFSTRFTSLGLLTCALVFTTYGVSRVVSLLLDGPPSASLVGALLIELVIGGIAIILVTRVGLHRDVSYGLEGSLPIDRERR